MQPTLDPATEQGLRPDMYGYAEGNPITYIDVSGVDYFKPWLVGSGNVTLEPGATNDIASIPQGADVDFIKIDDLIEPGVSVPEYGLCN